MPFAERLIRVALAVILASIVAATKTDPDLWGHIRFGIDIIHARSPRLVDTYSFTADRPWVNHEWGAEAVSAAAYLAGGNTGMVVLKLIVMGAVLLLLNRALIARGATDHRRRDLVLAAAVITTLEQAHNIRPQLFSLLLFAALLATLVHSARDRRLLLVLPPLFALWANVHGGWIVGGAVLGLWSIGLVASGAVRRTAETIVAGAFSLGATLINPHGIGLLRFLLRTVGFERADIVEWQPVYLVSWSVRILWVAVAAIAVFGLARAASRRGRLADILVITALGVASFRVNRLLAFFALSTLFLVGAELARAIPLRATRESGAGPQRRAARSAAVAIALVLLAAGTWSVLQNASCVAIDPRTTPPPGAVEFLESSGGRGRLLVWFDWGEYAIWHLAPALRVSIDGRRETLYSPAVLDAHLRFYFDAPGGADLPRTLAADYVWIPKTLPAAQRLHTAGWTTAYTDAESVIFSRGESPRDVRVAPAAFRRCFPGP